MQDWINGKIIEETEEGYLILMPKAEEVKEFNISECLIKLQSPSLITEEQRKKAWVLIGDIAEGTNRIGRFKDAVHKEMKQMFCEQNYITRFSLSNCSREKATKYIEFLISYILKHDIPSEAAQESYDDTTEKFLYARFMSDKCMICDNDCSRYISVDDVIEKDVSPNTLSKGDKIYCLCDKHADYLLKKGKRIFEQVYILEPLVVGENMINKIKEERK